jgi:hypothetical protein
MNLPVKAALMSAFLLPGFGQIYLKRYLRGLLFLLPVLAGLTFMVASVLRAVWESLNRLQVEGGTVDPTVIEHVAGGVSYTGTISFIIMVIWVASVIDAYFTGKQKEIKPTSRSGSKVG